MPAIIDFENKTVKQAFVSMYGADEAALAAQKQRYDALAARHEKLFGARDGGLFVSAPGRTELAGNHTDHNNGCVLAASVNLDTVAYATPNDQNKVTLWSEGWDRPFVIDLGSLSPRASEKNTTDSLIRGVAARMAELGYPIGGFDATVCTTVFRGSGLSSSAAFEVLVAAVFDALYGGFTMDAKTRARIGQYAENVYFGKPCGLLDQMTCSYGGLVTIDFGTEDAQVDSMTYDFDAEGYVPMVVSAGGEHGNLTAEYASIPAEMKQVAAALGGKVLRDIQPEAMIGAIPTLKGRVPDRAILRALHFYDENKRVLDAVQALREKRVMGFMEALVASGESSWKLLQNLCVPGSANQEMPLALELSRRMLQGRGAWRIHGGGFAGTILAFVPVDDVPAYTALMNGVFGEGSVTRLRIRPVGAVRVIP